MVARAVAAAAIVCSMGVASAEPEPTHPHRSPYAGLEARAVKALSNEQIADLRAGRGMGLALAAELNGYPGPMHVLELARPLKLTPSQRERLEAMTASMKVEAQALGRQLIKEEGALDSLFASQAATSSSVRATMAKIGSTQGALRASHLTYHLEVKRLLTQEQTAAYGALRGYAEAPGSAPSHGHSNRHAH